MPKGAYFLLSAGSGVVLVSAVALSAAAVVEVARGDVRVGLIGTACLLVGLTVVARLKLPPRSLLGGYSLVVYAFLYVPIVVVVVYAFNAGRVVTHWEGFSTRWFGVAWSDPGTRAAVFRSFEIGISVAVGCVALGTAAAIALVRSRFGLRLGLESLMLVTLVVPELVFAIAVFSAFLDLKIQFGMTTIMLGHMVVGTSLVALVVRARLIGMVSNLEEASADLGATPAGTLRQVTLPRILPAMVAGGFLAFTFSFDNVVITQFTVGAGNETWPLRVLSSLRFGVRPDVNATVALMLGVTIVALGCAGVAFRFGSGKARTRAAKNTVVDLEPEALMPQTTK